MMPAGRPLSSPGSAVPTGLWVPTGTQQFFLFSFFLRAQKVRGYEPFWYTMDSKKKIPEVFVQYGNIHEF